MEAPAEICENYQLSWSSYTSYIHSCISSSLINEESFADVALVTMDGHKIMAHRFVLSYASQYLNKALRFQPKVTTALPIMVVLPQEITYKALKILVKYMYSGEATVPKDILNVVLKAGDILRIKGLYREPEDQNKLGKAKATGMQVTAGAQAQAQKTKELKTTMEVHSLTKNPPPLVPTSSVTSKIIQTQTEAVKSKEGQKVIGKIISSKLQSRGQEKQVATSSGVKQYGGPKVLNFSMSNFNGTIEKENASSSKKAAIILNQKVSQADKPHTITSADTESQNSSDSTTVTIKAESGKGDNLSYLVIKDEPVEWTDADMEIVEEKEVFPEETVKTESFDSTSNEGLDDTFREQANLKEALNINPDSLDDLLDIIDVGNDYPGDSASLIPIPSNKRKSTQTLIDSEPPDDLPALITHPKNVSEPTKLSSEEQEQTDSHYVIIEDSNSPFEDEALAEASSSFRFEDSAQSESDDSDEDSTRPNIDIEALKRFDVVDFFNQDLIGRALVQRASKGLLTNSDRDRLADLIITYFLNKYKILQMKHLKILAKRFEQQLPGEVRSTYFIDPIGKKKSTTGKSIRARGKLMDKVRNKLQLIKVTWGMTSAKEPKGFYGNLQLNPTDENCFSPPEKKFKPNEPPDLPGNYQIMLKHFHLYEFINQDRMGQALLAKAHEKILTNSDRDRLADLIITHFNNMFEGHLDNRVLKWLAKTVEDQIPNEKSTTYYIDPVPKSASGRPKPARGKLTDKSKNLRYLIRTLNGEKKFVGPKTGSLQRTSESEGEPVDYIPQTAKESQAWLKEHFEPISEVLKHWQESSVIRKKSKTEIPVVFEEWPVLKTPLAPILVSQDFNEICKWELTLNFEESFETLFKRVRDYRFPSINSQGEMGVAELLDSNITKDTKVAIQLYLLANLIPNKGRMFLGGKSWWKPSVSESRDGYLVHVTSKENLLGVKQRKTEAWASKKLPVTPYMVFVAPQLNQVKEIFVVLSDHEYECTSMLEAVCFCFKLFHSLKIKYPFESQHIWYLIQWEIFKYRREDDIQLAFMNDLLTIDTT